MDTFYFSIAFLLIVVAILPFITDQHWVFRVGEFARVQVFAMQVAVIVFGFWVQPVDVLMFWVVQGVLGLLAIYNLIVLVPYTPWFPSSCEIEVAQHTESISVLSVNVYQFNTDYQQLISLVREVKPDVLLTMESNQAWEDALEVLESEFGYSKKIALENTYGMHFYTRLKVHQVQVNYFMADDLPSVEATLYTATDRLFTVFGVHPPPPSPTEEDTSRERDGELLAVARKVREYDHPVLVVGDFNNVAWARSAILFRKTSGLIDPRIGRGFISTFHARYRLLRFPIDLLFHSTGIFIEELKTLRPIGSDHLPLYCRFFINEHTDVQQSETDALEREEAREVVEMIRRGKAEESSRSEVAEE